MASAAGTNISDNEIKNKFLTVVKDVEVEDMIGKTTEFNDCRNDNKFVKDNKDKDKNLQIATACFKKKLVGKDPKALQKLAEDLRLENYGLIKSKNVNDITDYLAKKMHKSLTGIDPDEKDPKKMLEQLKWENRKIVDQKVFIDMYNGQLMKSALFEVSKFCFENLRKKNATGANFSDHWNKSLPEITDPTTNKEIPNVSEINDQSLPPFFDENAMKGTDMSKSADVIGKIVTGLTPVGTPVDAEEYGKFFLYCQKAMPLLCEEFRKTVKDKTTDTATKEEKTVTVGTEMTKGANACLTMDRLKAIRITLSNTEKVIKQFEEMGEDSAVALTNFKSPKFYERGKGANEESLDEITSYSSADMLAGSKEDKEDLATKCSAGQSSECDEYLVEGDSLDKAIHNVESEMNLKREIEVATVEQIKDKPEELEKYLSDNGHFDLLNKINDKTNPLSKDEIVAEISKIFDARKVAEIETLKLKVGKRQMNEKEITDLGEPGKQKQIVENINANKNERARLAQVVMFNNIITSQLDLTDKTSGDSVGRNVNGWKKELAGMEGTKSYDDSLFSGIKAEAEKNGSKVDDASIVGGGIIDSILGKAP